MEKMKGQIVVNLVTSSEEFAKLLKSTIDQALEEFRDSLPLKDDDELVTIKNAALFFQVSETTIHAWKNSGGI